MSLDIEHLDTTLWAMQKYSIENHCIELQTMIFLKVIIILLKGEAFYCSSYFGKQTCFVFLGNYGYDALVT